MIPLNLMILGVVDVLPHVQHAKRQQIIVCLVMVQRIGCTYIRENVTRNVRQRQLVIWQLRFALHAQRIASLVEILKEPIVSFALRAICSKMGLA